jgi:hypothetical protein
MALPATDSFAVDNFGTNWTIAIGSFDASGGQARSLSVAQFNAAYWSADAFNADQYSQARLIDDGGNYPGVAVRVSGSGATWNGYAAFRYTPSGDIVRLNKYVGGVETALSPDFGTVSDSTVVKLQVTGTTLEVFFDGVSQGTRTDGDLSSGSAGLAAYSTSIWDDFQADNVSGGDTVSWLPVTHVATGPTDFYVAAGMTPPDKV